MSKLLQPRKFLWGTALVAGVIGIGAGLSVLQNGATAEEAMVEAPIFEVDPLWPKPLPNEALLGMTIGVSVDADDNVWIVHRGSSTLNNNERGAELVPPVANLPPFGAARDRVQPRRRRDPLLGRQRRRL